MWQRCTEQGYMMVYKEKYLFEAPVSKVIKVVVIGQSQNVPYFSSSI